MLILEEQNLQITFASQVLIVLASSFVAAAVSHAIGVRAAEAAAEASPRVYFPSVSQRRYPWPSAASKDLPGRRGTPFLPSDEDSLAKKKRRADSKRPERRFAQLKSF
jgi:hypothetical protein